MSNTQLIWPVSLTVLILSAMSIFYVGENEKVIKFQLGEIVESDYKPGLHFKVPFINNISAFFLFSFIVSCHSLAAGNSNEI